MTMTESQLTGTQKVAILLMRMGKERSAKVLRNLKEVEVAPITAEIAKLINVVSEHVSDVMGEFRLVAAAHRHVAQGGVDFARDLLVESLGEEKASVRRNSEGASMNETWRPSRISGPTRARCWASCRMSTPRPSRS